jgi:hypothetical protein
VRVETSKNGEGRDPPRTEVPTPSVGWRSTTLLITVRCYWCQVSYVWRGDHGQNRLLVGHGPWARR